MWAIDFFTLNLFRKIKDLKQPLHYLLAPVKVSHGQTVLRSTYPYQLPFGKTTPCGVDTEHIASRRSFKVLRHNV